MSRGTRVAWRGEMENTTNKPHSNESVRHRRTGVNVPVLERIVTVGLGGLVLATGRKRSLLPKLLLSGAGVALLARGLSGRCPYYRARSSPDEVAVERSILIDASPSEVFAAWRNLATLPQFLSGIQSVTEDSDKVSHWVAALGPFRLQWSAEIVDELRDERLQWRALPDADIEHEGVVELSEYPSAGSTLLHLQMRFRPSGVAGLKAISYLAKMFTEQKLAVDLIRFRQFMETGEIATGASQRENVQSEGSSFSAGLSVAKDERPSTTVAEV